VDRPERIVSPSPVFGPLCRHLTPRQICFPKLI
jgi:hypothetical protein